ncbi:hypothetical protein DSM104329_05090 [Capillimicrobium parvum]|uniref:Amylo-alpha-1,6-glucosidase n=1 Tax=Capillimicrobium parvum TaxID=2884022 RepID=A0A9E6Y202_9ACTN|nr:hypothetical protein DSM104329_05090 [Capillimicrobium parvum]
MLEGSTFVVSNRNGDLDPACRHPPHGFFAQDTRFVSRWHLSVSGRTTEVLSTAQVDHFAAQFFLVPPTRAFHGAPPISIVRQRLIRGVWVEQLLVVNHCDDPSEVAVELDVGSDFADIFDVKDERIDPRHVVAHPTGGLLTLRYRNGAFVRETRVAVSEPAEIDEDTIRVSLGLGPREERVVTFVVTPHAEQTGRRAPERRASGTFEAMRRDGRAELDAWVAGAPRLTDGADALRHVYDRSLVDLAALRFSPHLCAQDESLPAAGLPWFMTLFGRDSIITSYQVLPYLPQLARTTLRTLAALQATALDDFRDAEPGKILHEVRFGEHAATGRSPHSPYFGTADATPLFVVLLDEYLRWTGDRPLVLELEDAVRRALEWIDRWGDFDGDGYVEYETRNPASGLANQCWKDSWNSILFADGSLARGPIATCEIQGYVYDAKRRGARLAREVLGDRHLADRLDAEAVRLRRRFQEDFWIEERQCFALALDGDKRRVDSVTSNVGQLLWSGIVDDERAGAVVHHLMGDRLYSGWGVRTMADGEHGYNPVEYHNGTVWPHDNSLIADGLRRYGYAPEAARIAGAMIRAATYFGHALPEVFAGFPQHMTHAPVVYPTASQPQAWAAAAPLLMLTTVLGLVPGRDGLTCDPHLPAEFGEPELVGVRGHWGQADIRPSAGVDRAVALRG